MCAAAGSSSGGATSLRARQPDHEYQRQEQQAGYEAVKHQRFVGTGYFDAVQQAITNGTASTVALEGSTEEAQFTGVIDPRTEDRSIEDPSMKGLIADPAMADPSLMAACWEASDELMPSGD